MDTVGTARPLTDDVLQYVDGKGAALRCRVRLFELGRFETAPRRYVLVVEDLGQFITQTIDRISSILVRQWEVDPARLRVVEHYPAVPATPDRCGEPESFAFVGFNWQGMMATNPTWRPTTREQVQAELGPAVRL